MKPYYDDGKGIVIYHGDCREVLPILPQVDLVLTDPPFHFQSSGGGFYGEWGSRKGYPDHEQRKYIDQLQALNCCEFDASEFLAALNCRAVAACMNKELIDRYISWARGRKWLFDVHVMAKSNPIPAKASHFLHDLEYLVVAREPRSFWFPDAPFDCYRKWFQSYNDGGKAHPAEKPVALMAKYVSVLCPVSGVVLDPYMGSGTTLRAAKDLGRRAIGIEIEERYCEIAARRLSQEVLDFSEVSA